MITGRAGYALYEIPELEVTEFAISVSTCPGIEDANDVGRMGDSISITLDISDEISTFDE
jgi:hypothetical protein